MARWRKSIVECGIMTGIFMAMILIAKEIAILTVPKYAGMPLFGMNIGVLGASLNIVNISIFFYFLSIPLQEFIFRGVIQGLLMKLLIGRRRVLLAVLISNLFFAAVHLPLHWLFPVVVFIPGVLWGWLYARAPTLLGVTLSHFILGIWAFNIVSFPY